jgi:tRNA pseudouridine32 synthase/23S rRNA pseudouridine746 synthase
VKARAPVLLSDEDKAFVRSRVLIQDSHILVLDKPAGLSSQGGRIQAHTLDDLLWAFARSNGKRPELVHRLDRDTSGVILAGKTKPALGFLGKAMQSRQLRKTYLALVGGGAPDPAQGDIRLALRREEIEREAYMRTCPEDHPDAQASHSRYRTLAASDEAALVELEPLTGRMHQLRVHLAAIGRPILGDARYGGALTAGGAAVPRLMLHAAWLDFPHPEGGRKAAEAPLPDDMAEVRTRLGL